MRPMMGLEHPSAGKIYLGLGDMPELGQDEARYNKELAEPILMLNPHGVYLYGSLMAYLKSALRARHYKGILLGPYSHERLVRTLLSTLRKGDWLLIKGSRGMRMEGVLKTLKSAYQRPRVAEWPAPNDARQESRPGTGKVRE